MTHWPAREWNWQPDYDTEAFFDQYFLPQIRARYGLVTAPAAR